MAPNVYSYLVERQTASPAGAGEGMPPGIPPPDTSPSHIRLTTAPEYFGSISGWLFFGFVMTQFYNYTTSRARDPPLLRFLVYFSIIVVCFQVATETFSGYQILVDGWGNEQFLVMPPKFLIFDPLVNSLLAFIVQNFYVWRIWSFQQSILARIFCGLMSALSLLSAIGGFAITGIFFSIDVQSRLTAETKVYNMIWLICGAIVDIAIAVSTSVLLRKAQTKTTVRDTRHVLGKLIRLTIQTGALTAVLAIIILCLFTVESKTGLLQTLAGYMLGKSYVLSLLANLNIRGKAIATLHKSELPLSSSLNFDRRGSRLTGNFGGGPKSPGWQGVSFLSAKPEVIGSVGVISSNGGVGVVSNNGRGGETGTGLGTLSHVGSFSLGNDLSSGLSGSRNYEASSRSTPSGILVTKQTEQFRESDIDLDIDFSGSDIDGEEGSYKLQRMDTKSKEAGVAV